MSNSNLEDINERICNRDDCFYWQTDRKISAEEAALIWKDRHSAITNEELFSKINSELTNDKLKYIEPFDENAQTSLGNVNSIRIGVLESGKKVIIRCHPKMALRIKRYTYEQTPFLKGMIEKGEKHLEELIKIFNLEDTIVKKKTII